MLFVKSQPKIPDPNCNVKDLTKALADESGKCPLPKGGLCDTIVLLREEPAVRLSWGPASTGVRHERASKPFGPLRFPRHDASMEKGLAVRI